MSRGWVPSGERHSPPLGQVTLDYRFALELCAPARGNQKGAVENLVGWVLREAVEIAARLG